MSVNIDDIRSFLTVAKTCNITRASEILGVTQPTLSYAIKRLENTLGTEVIVRLKNGVELTKSGEEFQKRANSLLNQWEDTINIFSEKNDFLKGEYSIGIHPSLAISTLPKILKLLQKEMPLINFNLIHDLSRIITSKVIDFEVDFGIAVNPIAHPDLVIKELRKDIVTLFKVNNSSNKIIYDPSLIQSQTILKSLNKTNIKVDGHIHTNNLEVIAQLCADGLGIGLLPKSIAKSHANLKEIPNAPVYKDRICLIYRKEKHKNPTSKKLISLLRNIKQW